MSISESVSEVVQPAADRGDGGTARFEKPSMELLAQALGTPDEAVAKAFRLVKGLAQYLDRAELDRRLRLLQARGYVQQIPSPLQLVVGSVDMLRFWIAPASEDYYRAKGISFTFHQVLRFLDEPASLIDPIGLLSDRDGIIGHLMQVVHANPCYDLQLLEMFEDGLGQLEMQLEKMLAGTHPRAASIAAIVEEPDYHQRLLDYTRSYRADPTTPPPVRVNVEQSAHFSRLEETFGTLPGAMAYFLTLPSTVPGAIWHLLNVHEFPG
jgi:hypothetical protein